MLVRLKDIETDSARDLGSKATNLGRLLRLGFAVPDGFVVPAKYYRDHVSSPPFATVIEDLVDRQTGHRAELQKALAELRALILEAPTSAALENEITDALRTLDGGPVAVRSSAGAEDLPGHSFAGLYDSFLGVRGSAAVAQAVKRCWASLWSDRAFEYRCRNGFDDRNGSMSVVVQTLVPAEVSGVLFTSDPRGHADRILIEASFGLGEAIVSGRVSPDRVVLSKPDLRIVESSVSEKCLQVAIGSTGEIEEQSVAQEYRTEPCLSNAIIHELGALGLRVEKDLGEPQDVEWALSSGRPYILQSRPITTLGAGRLAADRQVWSNLNAGEVLPDVVAPMTWSVVERMIYDVFGLILGRLGMEFGEHKLIGQIAGRAYFNLNTFTGMMRKIPGLGSLEPTQMFGGRQGDPTAGGGALLQPDDIPDLHFHWIRFLLSFPRFLAWLLSHSTQRGLQFAASLRRDTLRLEQSDLQALSDEALLTRFEYLHNNPRIVMRAVSYGGIGAMFFAPVFSISRRWLGDHDGSLANRLLGGLGGMESAQSGLDLWALAVFAHENLEVERTLLESSNFAQAESMLPCVSGGPEFLNRWQQFMKRHGHHSRAEIELMNPRWRETPDQVLTMVQSYLRNVGDRDPAALHRARMAERRRLDGEWRAKLRNPIKRQLFEVALNGARRGCLVRENIKSEAVRRIAHGRAVLLELGRRLSKRDVLEKEDDIFFLDIQEVAPVLCGQHQRHLRETIRLRRAEYQANLQISPPAVVVGRFDRSAYDADEVDSDVRVLTGLAVSSGVATGRARVILRSDTTEQVEPGEILIAPFTDPGWTPYFIRAGAIVMDLGGLLSHGSVIAREYGIPAVANVGPATRLIRTGQRVHVDGNRGQVRILEPMTADGAGTRFP
jgi:pyruvate,water dikinase